MQSTFYKTNNQIRLWFADKFIPDQNPHLQMTVSPSRPIMSKWRRINIDAAQSMQRRAGAST